MPQDYAVQEGDCMSSIAYANGFFWQTLWDDASNADLKSKRKDPNVLMQGDVVHIPDLTLKQEPGATELKHSFRLKGVPAKLKIRLLQPKPQKTTAAPPSASGAGSPGSEDDDGTSDLADPDYIPPAEDEEPIKNAPYIVEVDGVFMGDGKTDGNGCLTISIQPNAAEGRLTVNKGTPEEKVYMLALGGMDPVDEISGVRKRLANLGYCAVQDGPADADDLDAALRRFQEDNSLNVTGKIDDATKAKLKEAHGC